MLQVPFCPMVHSRRREILILATRSDHNTCCPRILCYNNNTGRPRHLPSLHLMLLFRSLFFYHGNTGRPQHLLFLHLMLPGPLPQQHGQTTTPVVPTSYVIGTTTTVSKVPYLTFSSLTLRITPQLQHLT
jgi:hypothetical protein